MNQSMKIISAFQLREMAMRAKIIHPAKARALFDAFYRRQRSRGIYG
jgi:hypothetical protein